MPTRLPSGNWRVQARRVIDGRPERKSFTAPNKKDALIAAAAWQEEAEKASALPLAEAVRQYIDSLDGVRSPATVRGYKVILNILLRDQIGQIPVAELTKKDVSDAVQRWSKAVAPKTVRNRHGLISAALKQFRPALVLRTPLPEARKKEINVPTDEDIRSLMAQTAGTVLEVPVILGAFAGMRRGEVAALRGEDVFNGYIHVRRTSVVKYGGEVVQKDPKTAAGARRPLRLCHNPLKRDGFWRGQPVPFPSGTLFALDGSIDSAKGPISAGRQTAMAQDRGDISKGETA